MSMGNSEITEPLAETKAKVEAKYGPLDWEALKSEAKILYEKYNPSKAD